ncbi:MAG: hypothetical protein KGL39_54955, partial [Patescibacteria group bacterium]|nr:hypothetical protein [Patescibacteria group bacterium]
MSQYSVQQTEVGFAFETIRHTAAAAPAFWAKLKSPKWKPNLALIEDDTLQGNMNSVQDATPGLLYDTHGWTTYPYLDVLPAYIRAELGATDTVAAAPTNTTLASSCVAGAATISTTATIAAGSWFTLDTGALLETCICKSVTGAGPYTVTPVFPIVYAHSNGATVTGLTGHQYSVLNNGSSNTLGNQPPSCTLWDFDGDQWRQMAGGQMDKFDLKMTPDKAPTLDVTWLTDAHVTPSTPTPSWTSNSLPPGWTTRVMVGTSVLAYIEDVEVSMARGVKP